MTITIYNCLWLKQNCEGPFPTADIETT